jgi:hypothetical protein
MTSAQALQFLGILWSNYHRLAKQVDLDLMPPDARDVHIENQSAMGPFIRAAWFGRQGYIISAWSLWEYYSRAFCLRLPVKAYDGAGSCVDKVGRALQPNSIFFPQQDWFTGANALRNIIAHYSGLVVGSRARNLFAAAKTVAFPHLELCPDNYVQLQPETASGLQWEIEEFIRQIPQPTP